MAEEARRPEDITPPRNNSMASDNAPNPEKDQSEAGNSGVLGELINHKTLTWWYVVEPCFRTAVVRRPSIRLDHR